MKSYRIALMCAEKDALTCHRTILVCRQLRSEEIDIFHILEDGNLENNRNSERRLLKMLKIPEIQLFETPEDLIQRAYRIQGEKMTYARSTGAERAETVFNTLISCDMPS